MRDPSGTFYLLSFLTSRRSWLVRELSDDNGNRTLAPVTLGSDDLRCIAADFHLMRFHGVFDEQTILAWYWRDLRARKHLPA